MYIYNIRRTQQFRLNTNLNGTKLTQLTPGRAGFYRWRQVEPSCSGCRCLMNHLKTREDACVLTPLTNLQNSDLQTWTLLTGLDGTAGGRVDLAPVVLDALYQLYEGGVPGETAFSPRWGKEFFGTVVHTWFQNIFLPARTFNRGAPQVWNKNLTFVTCRICVYISQTYCKRWTNIEK